MSLCEGKLTCFFEGEKSDSKTERSRIDGEVSTGVFTASTQTPPDETHEVYCVSAALH